MAGPITISILANGRQAKAEIDQVTSRTQKIGTGFKKAALPAAAVAAGLVAIGKGALDAVANVERINAQTTAVVKSTGGAANVTAKQVETLANKLEKVTTTEAEATQEGANLLLTFTNIKNEAGRGNKIFDRTTTAMVDLARAMGTEPKAAAIQLGKALNDPIKGVGALSRVGVSFTEQQKATIKSLVESGDVMGAQKIILKELETQFGGSGKAFAQTAEGMKAKAANSWGNMTEGLVVGLLPAMTKLIEIGTGAMDWAAKNEGKVKVLVLAIAALSATVLAVNGVMAVSGAIMAVYRGAALAVRGAIIVWKNAQLALNLAMMLNPVGVVVVAIVALIAIIVVAWKRSETFRRIVTGAWKGIKAVTTSVFNAVKNFLGGVWRAIVSGIRTQVRVAANVVRNVWAGIRTATSAAWNAIRTVVGTVVRAVVTVVRSGFSTARTVIRNVWDAVRTGTRNAWDGIREAVRNAVTRMLEIVRGVRQRVVNVFVNAGGWLLGAGRRIVQGLLDGIGAMIGRVRSKLAELTNLIPDWKGPAERDARLLRPAGELIIGGLVDGFDRQRPKVRTYLKALSKDISTFDASPRAELELTARQVYSETGGAGRRVFEVHLTADRASDLQQGRRVKAQITAFEDAGGR